MKLGKCWSLGLAVGVLSVSALAGAQEAPSAPVEAAPGHASGVMVQGRLQTSGGLLSLGGGPGFLFGYQGPSFALGLGLGLNRIGISGADDTSGSLLLFQVMPTGVVDVWQSADGRAHANLIGGIGYGHASLDVTSTNQVCNFDPITGAETCTSQNEDNGASAGFVPFMLGFGGDYFLSRNFALGAEVGLQAAITTGLSQQSGGTSQDVDGSGNLQLAYGALRATFVLGD